MLNKATKKERVFPLNWERTSLVRALVVQERDVIVRGLVSAKPSVLKEGYAIRGDVSTIRQRRRTKKNDGEKTTGGNEM